MSEPAVQPASVIPQWTFGDKLRKVRRHVGLSQAEFAAQLATNTKSYSSWESDQAKPRQLVAVAKRIEAMTGVPAAWLLDLDGPYQAPHRAGDTGAITHVQSATVQAAVIPFPLRTHAATTVPQMVRDRHGDFSTVA